MKFLNTIKKIKFDKEEPDWEELNKKLLNNLIIKR